MKHTYKSMRQIALGGARSEMRKRGINPLESTANDALAVLDDICRNEGALILYVWYIQCNSTNQTRLFKQEWNKWRKDNENTKTNPNG